MRCASDGARIVIASKTTEPNPKLPGTIHSVAAEVEATGGQALALALDVRDEEAISDVMAQAAKRFGGIDALINNAGAIYLTNTEMTPLKRYDLMQDINTRAVFSCSQAALPYLKKSACPHILNLSPPISLERKWLQDNLAYTISKYGMTLCTIGMSAEFERYRIAVNSLWPRTTIATTAIERLMGEAGMKQSRKPEIMADAAHVILCTTDRKFTGQVLIDEDVLRDSGVTDFDLYAYAPGEELLPDFYIDS